MVLLIAQPILSRSYQSLARTRGECERAAPHPSAEMLSEEAMVSMNHNPVATNCAEGSRPAGAAQWPTQANVTVATYTSVSQLRSKLRALDSPERQMTLTVVLVLPVNFNGDLVELIQRRYRGLRLVLISGGALPGGVSIGDLSVSAAAFGWHQIMLRPDFQQVLDQLLACLQGDEQCVIFRPEANWRC